MTVEESTLDKILQQITIDLLPCAYFNCEQNAHEPFDDHIYRPQTDLYDLGWYDGSDDDGDGSWYE